MQFLKIGFYYAVMTVRMELSNIQSLPPQCYFFLLKNKKNRIANASSIKACVSSVVENVSAGCLSDSRRILATAVCVNYEYILTQGGKIDSKHDNIIIYN